jgi:hypothetical protein
MYRREWADPAYPHMPEIVPALQLGSPAVAITHRPTPSPDSIAAPTACICVQKYSDLSCLLRIYV